MKKLHISLLVVALAAGSLHAGDDDQPRAPKVKSVVAPTADQLVAGLYKGARRKAALPLTQAVADKVNHHDLLNKVPGLSKAALVEILNNVAYDAAEYAVVNQAVPGKQQARQAADTVVAALLVHYGKQGLAYVGNAVLGVDPVEGVDNLDAFSKFIVNTAVTATVESKVQEHAPWNKK